MKTWSLVLASCLAGAGLIFLFDPASGARRRGRLRDRAAHASKLAREAGERFRRDLQNREHGLVARASALLRAGEASDPVLNARARSLLGRLTSHAAAIETLCHDGRIELSGDVLEQERERIVRGIGHVRGVRAVVDRLAVRAPK
jgi:hypothetical protein